MDAIALFDPVGAGDIFKQTAREMGYKVIAIFPSTPEFYEQFHHCAKQTLSKNCDEMLMTGDFEEILTHLKNSKFTIKACIAGNEGGVELAIKTATALKLISNPLEKSDAYRDKGKMRELLKKSGLSCPAFTMCASEKELKQFAQKHTFPLVIKTPKGFGTNFVFVCEALDHLVYSFQEIMNTKDLYGASVPYAVVEEYIGGREYVIDTFSDGNHTQVTDVWYYDKIESATFKNIYYNIVSVPLNDPSLTKLIDYAIQITSVFCIEKGCAHIELKDDHIKGPTLIEIGARPPGASVTMLISKYSNFNPCRATIEVFTQGKITLPKPIIYHKHLAVAFCSILEEGKIAKILGVEQIQKLPSYQSHQLEARVGEFLSLPSHMGTIPCRVFLAHADRAQLFEDIEKTHELFTITFD